MLELRVGPNGVFYATSTKQLFAIEPTRDQPGANRYSFRTATNEVSCVNAVFGDPTPNVVKQCWVQIVPPRADNAPLVAPGLSRTATGSPRRQPRCQLSGSA